MREFISPGDESPTADQQRTRTRNQAEPPYCRRLVRPPSEALALVGTPIPIQAPSAVRAGRRDVFTHTHANLMMFIDMMAGWRGEGCWATDAHLARTLGRSVRRVKQLLRDCRAAGILVDRGIQPIVWRGKLLRRRVVEAVWSKASGPPSEGNGLPPSEGNGLPPYQSRSRSRTPPSRAEALDGGARKSPNGLLREAAASKPAAAVADFERGLTDAEAFAPTPTQTTNVPPPTTGGAAPLAFADEGDAGPPPGGEGGPTGSVGEEGMDALQPSFEKRSIKGGPVLDFPPNPKDRPRTRTEPFDRALWADIRRFAVANRQPVTQSRRLQAAAVAILRRRVADAGVTEADIRRVWDTYTTAHAAGRIRMTITDGKQLDERWNDLVRLTGDRAAAVPPAAPVTSEVEGIVANLSMRGWPKGADSQLPAVVAASVANLRGFLKRLAAAPLPRGASRGDVEAVEFVVGLVVGYAETWWAGVWKQIHNWDEWRGDLAPWVWRPDHKAFVAAVVTALDRRNGSGGAALYQSLLSAAAPKERT